MVELQKSPLKGSVLVVRLCEPRIVARNRHSWHVRHLPTRLIQPERPPSLRLPPDPLPVHGVRRSSASPDRRVR